MVRTIFPAQMSQTLRWKKKMFISLRPIGHFQNRFNFFLFLFLKINPTFDSIKNAISNLEKRNCISVKARLIIHTVLRICPSSVFSTYSSPFLEVTFLSDWSILIFYFRKNHVAISVLAAFIFIPMPPKNNNCCR